MRSAILFAIALFACTSASRALAETPLGTPPILGAVLSVAAQGKSTGVPDRATVSLGVVTEASNATNASSQNAQRMTALISALTQAGVGAQDVHTSELTIEPQQNYSENHPRITGYRASNTVSVRVRDLTKLSTVIDASIAAGGNAVNSVRFEFADETAQLDRAREDAISEARRRADVYARSLHMSVYRVLSVTEPGTSYEPGAEEIVVTGQRVAGVAPTPVSPGEVETNASVTVTFELR